MDILLWIIGAIVAVVVGIPVVLILAALVLYLVLLLGYTIIIFVVGIACIPISIVARLTGKTKDNTDLK